MFLHVREIRQTSHTEHRTNSFVVEMIILAQILLHKLLSNVPPSVRVVTELEENVKTDKEKLDRVREEKKELERQCEERECQMKEKMGRTEGELNRTTERNVDLERQVDELKAHKHQTQVTFRVMNMFVNF